MEPFDVTIRSQNGRFRQTERIFCTEKARFCVPEGQYMLRSSGGRGMNPGGQCRWFRVRAGQSLCYSAVFRGVPAVPEPAVRFTLRDSHYPNIIPINGGITVMAASDKIIPFTNGAAEDVYLPAGRYTFVSTDIPGYKDGTVQGFTITKDTTQVPLTITAAGKLVVNVVDVAGNKVQGGTLQLSNEDGTETYGDPVAITDGVATFENVPYDADAGIPIWISQPASDEAHYPIAKPQALVMDQKEKTTEILNDRVSFQVDLTLEDQNYPGITPLNGTATFLG